MRWCATWSPTTTPPVLVTPGSTMWSPTPTRACRQGLAAEEYQLGNAELEAIERVRGGVGADRGSNLVTWLAQVDRRPRAALLGDGVVALVWLRAFGW